MPAIEVGIPDDKITPEQLNSLKESLRTAVAKHMLTEKDKKSFPDGFDPDLHIDLSVTPRPKRYWETTAAVMVTIVTYDKPDLLSRLKAIRDEVLDENPWMDELRTPILRGPGRAGDDTDLKDAISITFLPKPPDGWVCG